ncbi:MAG: 8-amino-7-oxononanoate synthase [Nitrospirae bacterium]|nr:8-amino-7-oxononanoate synthase [Nitrospirota bacterium]
MMTPPLNEILEARLGDLERAGLRRAPVVLDGPTGPRVRIGQREFLLFASNDYLGLAAHPALAAAGIKAIEAYGAGSGASRLVSGSLRIHAEAEESAASFERREAAILFPSGYQANIGVLAALAGEGDVIFSDALNHASIVDGCRLSRAKKAVYNHGNLNHLEDLLKREAGKNRWIVTEAVFSMDGDVAPLGGIVDLANRHGAFVIVDEAHATGVLGPTGRGGLEDSGTAEAVGVQVATLGKALGCAGAYVTGSRRLIEFLRNRARSFVFTTSVPPVLAGMAIEAFSLVDREPERRDRLGENRRRMAEGLKRLGVAIPERRSAIFPLVVGGNERAVELAGRMYEEGVLVPAIRPPTVPEGTARLRLTVTAAHRAEDIDRVLNVLGRSLSGAA